MRAEDTNPTPQVIKILNQAGRQRQNSKLWIKEENLGKMYYPRMKEQDTNG